MAKSWNHEYFVSWLLLFFILAAYSLISWTSDFVFEDDTLFGMRQGPFHWFGPYELMMARGRWGGAVVISVVDWFIDTVSVLKWWRLFNAGVLAWFGVLVYRELRAWLTPFQAWLSIAVLLTLPAFAMCIILVPTFLITLALILAYYSAHYCRTYHVTGKTRYACVSIILLIAALTCYQSAAMAFIPLLLMMLMKPDDQSGQKKLHLFVQGVVIWGAAMGIYVGILVLVKPLTNSLFTRGGYDPLLWSFHPLQKISWFINEPLANVLRAWDIRKGAFPWVMGSVFILAIGINSVALARRWHRPSVVPLATFVIGILFFIGLFVSFVPNLAASFQAPYFRCLPVVSLYVWFTILIAFIQCSNYFPHQKNLIMTSTLIVLLVYGGISSSHLVFTQRVLPSIKEYQYITTMLNALPLLRYEQVHVIRRDANIKGARYTEWGTGLTDFTYELFPLMALLANGKAEGMPAYVSSQKSTGQMDYFLVKMNMTSMNKRIQLSEAGSMGLLRYMKEAVDKRVMAFYTIDQNTFITFPYGPGFVQGKTILIPIEDLNR